MLTKKVTNYVTLEGAWDFQKLLQVLDEECLQLFLPIKPPKDNLGEDAIAWLLTSSEEFSIACTVYLSRQQ